MSEEETEIDEASEDSPILTTQEPDFSRYFARGTLLRIDDNDPDILQVGFWSSKDEGIEVENQEGLATGYRLETEVMMTWDTAVRMRDLLDNYIEQHAPEEVRDN